MRLWFFYGQRSERSIKYTDRRFAYFKNCVNIRYKSDRAGTLSEFKPVDIVGKLSEVHKVYVFAECDNNCDGRNRKPSDFYKSGQFTIVNLSSVLITIFFSAIMFFHVSGLSWIRRQI